MHLVIFILALTTVLYATISKRVDKTWITPPMIFVSLGGLIAITTDNLINEDQAGELLEIIAELTLVVVLFIDASRINLRLLVRDYRIPLRMLGFGLPLTILFGALVAKLIFPEFSIWEAALLAAILAPTDAALGQAVVSSPDVPPKIRQSLNVESGLNDGIALPLVILCATMAGVSEGAAGGLTVYWIKQVTLGPIVGLAVGLIGGKALELARKLDWSNSSFQRVSGLALALLAWSAASLVGGNGFIAAFVAGMAVSFRAAGIGKAMQDFGEAEGQWLTLATFLLFGMTFVIPAFSNLTLQQFEYALLSLTVIRMLPVALSLCGLGFIRPTLLFVGWFGPRGLASLLFALLVVSTFEISYGETIFNTAMVTVVLSIFAHGITAVPASRLYHRIISARCDSKSLENAPCVQISSRHVGDRKLDI